MGEQILEEEVKEEKEKERKEEESEPSWKFSHRHHRIVKHSESPQEQAKRHWQSMHEGNKKNMIETLQNFKKLKELGDEEGATKAMETLEKIGQDAYENGDISTHKLMPHIIAELNKLKFEPLDKEGKDEGVEEEE